MYYLPETINQLPHSELPEVQALKAVFLNQKQAEGALKSDEARTAALQKLFTLIKNNKEKLLTAISKDYGYRCAYDTEILEYFDALEAIRFGKKHFKKWMRPKKARVSKWFLPSCAEVIFQPKGVVGIMVPWNYPLLLSIHPLVDALCAGNHCMIKISEYTVHFGLLLKQLMAEYFPENQIAVINGGLTVSEAFASLPFDHLFFTGSIAVGKVVMKAASQNLTPVTLELGGKSPALIHPDYSITKAVEKILQGKFYNAGQTCIATDYVLLTKDKVDAFILAAKNCFNRYYPDLANNLNYSNIINENHVKRLQGYVQDAIDKGAKFIPLADSLLTPDKVMPGLIVNVDESMRVVHEEIFGPLLPLLVVNHIEEAIAYINQRPTPLALYYFDDDKARVTDVLNRTKSGGATINNTLLHASQNNLPFGGAGSSGMGKYHGQEGFETFSNKRAVFRESKWSGYILLRAPFGKFAKILTKAMQRY